MNRYLLDTNIISNGLKPVPSSLLAVWMANQVGEELFIAAITVGEVWRGILEKPAGRKRRILENWFRGPDGPQAFFAGRILPFDERAGIIWGRLMAEGTRIGHPRSANDMILAAVAEANNCVLVTDNEKHFSGLRFINPMRPHSRT